MLNNIKKKLKTADDEKIYIVVEMIRKSGHT